MYKVRFCIIRLQLVIFAVMLINACASNVISIEADDSVSFSTVETSFPLSEQSGLRLKLRGSRVSGDFSQTVPAGKVILIDNTQISGPTDVSGTTDLTYVSVSLGSDNMGADSGTTTQKLNALVYVGLAQTHLDLTLVHAGNTFITDDRTTELYAQMGMSYEFIPSLYGGFTWAGSLGPDLSGISEFDLKLNYALFEHLEIMAGYRWFEYNYDVELDESNVRVDFNGPFIGLYVPF